MSDDCRQSQALTQVRVLRSWQEFEALESEWSPLLDRSRSKSIFLTWEWLKCWRKAVSDAVEPYVITVRNPQGRLLGVAPLYIDTIKALGVLNIRTLRVIGDVATGAEYPDWLVDTEQEESICDAIAKTIGETNSDWDAIWLTNVAGWTGADHRIRDALVDKGLDVRSRDRGFAYIELPEEMLEYEESFSAKSRQRLRRNTRKVLETENVEVFCCERLADLPDNLTALFELHQLRWLSTGVDGSFCRQPLIEDFYRSMAPVALEQGWLRLFVLTHNGIPKAVQFGYVYENKYLQIQEGFDPDFLPGAGNALRHHVIDHCVSSGIRHYDFLAGVSEHKRRWGAAVREGFDWFITNSTWRGEFLRRTGLWPTGRYLQQSSIAVGAAEARAHDSEVEWTQTKSYS